MTIRTIEIQDGRKVRIELPVLDEDHQVLLATGIADLLIRSGMISETAVMAPEQMLQFLGDMADAALAERTPIPETYVSLEGRISDYMIDKAGIVIDLDVATPYHHVVLIAIKPNDGQSVNMMRLQNDLMTKTVRIRALLTDGHLSCGIADVEVVA